jgi:signal transduction histidine kinase/DNA-binding response OmpR family regulator
MARVSTPAPLPEADPASDPFEHAADPMILLAPDGAPLRANAAFRAAFRHTISARRPPWGRVEPPPFAGDVRRFDSAAPDGRRFEWLERRLADGRRLAGARDVSERASAAEEAARAKTLLFATLTHELRTPLNGVIGMAGLLAQSRLEPAQAAWTDAIMRSGEHLLDLITEILDYSRLEAGRVRLEDVDFDVEGVAQSVAELLSPKAHAKGLDIVAFVDPATPARVRGDEGRLRQILFNLAGNAVKFTESGGVEIVAQPAPGRRGGQWLRVSVRDTGPGIAADKQALIFEDFAQADASTARRYGGAGLGLAIVRRLAAAMGGEAGLSSQLGQGALFWADLPFAPAQTADRAEAPSARLDGLRVAIDVESPFMDSALARALGALGARRALSEAGADVVLRDHARSTPANGDRTPVVLLIPQEERETVERRRSDGAQPYLIKPLRRRSLAERIALAARGATTRRPAIEDDRAVETRRLGLRVLLAEDNPINLLLARTLLARSGCIVEAVTDGEQAVAAAAEGQFDVILLDLRMPLLDGLGAARRIRALPGPQAQTPLIALTADAGEDDRTAALAAGMDDFLTKPIDAGRLGAALARVHAQPHPPRRPGESGAQPCAAPAKGRR